MNRQQILKLIKQAKSLGVKIDKKMLSLWKSLGMNSAQHDFFIRQLRTGIQEKTPQPLSGDARVLIKTSQDLGVEPQFYEFLSKPGSVNSQQELKLKSDLTNQIEDKRQEISNSKGGEK